MSSSNTIGDATAGSQHVSWMFELAIKPGRESDLRALAQEMSEATAKNEAGTLDYEWYVSDDGAQLHLFERYLNADAALIHNRAFEQHYMARFFDVLKPVRMVLYGAVDERVRSAMTPLAPQVITRAAGFSR